MKTLSLSKHRPQDVLPYHHIVWIEGQINYCVLHLNKGRSIIMTKTLKNLEEILSDTDFIRIHKQHIVNRIFISSVSPKSVLLSNGISLVLARRRKTVLF
jgi:two-component system LytT family response regulator